MLVLLCALINICSNKEQLNEAVRHSENAFKAAAVQSRRSHAEAENFMKYVLSDNYVFSQFQFCAESYMKYMLGDRFEAKWDNSDWWSNEACEDGTHSVCEYGELRFVKYCGPKKKEAW